MESEGSEVTDALKVAIVTGAFALVGTIISNWLNMNKITTELYAKLDKQSELADERMRGEIAVLKTEIKDLSQKVEKHNNMVERTYGLEKEVAKQGEQIKNLYSKVG